MTEERMKILEMLSSGIISVDEADKLLATLDKNKNEVKAIKNINRNLYIKVASKDNDKVNITVPLNLLNAVSKSGSLKGFLKNSVKINGMDSEFISENIDINMIIEMINSGMVGEIVNIESKDGDIIKIYIE